MSYERLLAIVLLVLLGCSASVPEAKFHVLASSGARILSTTGDTYARIVRLEQAFIVASMGDEKLTPDSFRPVVEGRSFDLEPELAFRQAALGVLVKYLRVLEAFASSETDADVDKASLELGASLEGLMETAAISKERGAQVSGILATGVDAIGREVSARQRARALDRVMDASQKDIERLANLVAESHAKLDRAIDVMVGQIVARANVVRPPPATVGRDEFYVALASTLRGAKEAHRALLATAEAVKQIPVAHAQIRQTLAQTRAPLDALKTLAHKAEEAGTFYGSTQKTIGQTP